ncbi:heme biosynthesis HemY N-terminal domain-containing protein [Aestuariivita sp.]|jgi:HemY protein|uniref:heme biosynthesis protein HemY n=1 Tax=Aestuariivita sp. TaxID=1872407 RepID=UPI00216D1639|nr:heme biosynthesis HemY N-terminal domain-containing protein [Aestuariivita sp.]MCE8005562.1 tetratricopeptide repeat protein [Aestuariivita sp.]
MLWSLIKILLFVVVVGALTLGAEYLLESEGGVQLTVAGTEYTLGPLQSVIAAAVLVFAVWVLLKLVSFLVAVWRFLNGDETAISRYFDRNRERKGFQALSEGMMALASGEGRLAMAKAAKAEKYLQKPELTNLLTAQAAELSGDRKKAEDTYKKLIASETTKFVGVRGIMKQRLADGDTDTARKLAEKAFQLKPKHEETQDVLLTLQAQAQDWSGARKTLSAKLKNGNLPRDVHRRRDAVLALSEAKEILNDENSIDAREAAIEANRMSPDLIPAAIMAARSYIEKGKPKYAIRVLKKAWEVQPHPELAAAFAEIAPNETPKERIKRFGVLTRIKPDHPETRLVLAELNLAAEDFPEARRALGDLVDSQGDARALTIMAAIERGEGAPDAVVKGWLARALNAPRGPQWVCDNCQHAHADWTPICKNCQSFDTLSWRAPSAAEVSSATGVQMLPLIVGSLEDKSAEEDVPEAEVEVVDAAEVIPPTEEPIGPPIVEENPPETVEAELAREK